MKKKFLSILCLLVMFLSLPTYALADDTTLTTNYDTFDEKGFVLEADNNVNYTKSVDGSALIAGNTVDVSNYVDGVLIGAGNTVTSSGSSEYAVLLGNSINASGTYIKDSLIAGNSININKNTLLERDAFIFGSDVTLSGTVGRNVTIYANTITLDNVTIQGDAKRVASKIVIKDATTIYGDVTYSDNDVNEISKVAKMGTVTTVKNEEKSYKDSLLISLYGYAGVLFVFAVLAMLIPKLFAKISKEEFDAISIFGACGYGLLLLVLVPILCIILFSLYIAIPLGLIILSLYFMILYLANIFAGYYVGKNIWAKVFKKESNMLLEGLVGITLLFVLSLIPYVGVVTSIISFLLGLGLAYNLCKNALKK